MTLTILTLLHLLIFTYWLGGDLGAFYASSFLTDRRRTVPERLLALKIINNVDMAPRTALILALPTGLLLAAEKGWLALPAPVLAGVTVLALAWLALAWRVHMAHGAAEGARKLDLAVRWLMLAGLVGTGLATLAGLLALPLFLGLKMLALAGCIALGVLVRVLLVPLVPAVRQMTATGATDQTDAAIAGVIARTRPAVMGIWVLLLAAAVLGLATPA